MHYMQPDVDIHGGKCILRPARAEDMAAVYAIEVDSLRSPWSYASFVNELSTSFSRFIVAELPGGIAGYAVAWHVTGEIQLNHIAVKKEYRRRGIARALIDHIVAELRPQGAGVILLEVASKNAAALNFYRALGFAENGTRRNYYPDDDAILMEKRI